MRSRPIIHPLTVDSSDGISQWARVSSRCYHSDFQSSKHQIGSNGAYRKYFWMAPTSYCPNDVRYSLHMMKHLHTTMWINRYTPIDRPKETRAAQNTRLIFRNHFICLLSKNYCRYKRQPTYLTRECCIKKNKNLLASFTLYILIRIMSNVPIS